jgi:putative AdoMet-dependent methyltransferase
MTIDPFPASDFDAWAATYDQDVTVNSFPFIGYTQVVDKVVQLAEARPGMKILDLGTGTGRLARPFLELGCRVTAVDFSSAMLAIARERLPGAVLLQADLRQDFSPELNHQRFALIVSGYVFHHFELAEKITILQRLAGLLEPGGRLLIADISFADRGAQQAVRQAAGDVWEEEFYWIASEAVPLLEQSGFAVQYQPVSACAGVYLLTHFAVI